MKKLLLPILCFVSFNCIIHAQVVSLPSEGWSLNLGKEFPGATGSLAYAPVTGPTGEIAYRLQGSFLQGGAYVSAGLGNLDLVLTSITFQVRASGLPAIAVRLTDGSGQIHQINRIDLEKVAGWQTVTLRLDHLNAFAWGGANNGIFRGPLGQNPGHNVSVPG